MTECEPTIFASPESVYSRDHCFVGEVLVVGVQYGGEAAALELEAGLKDAVVSVV